MSYLIDIPANTGLDLGDIKAYLDYPVCGIFDGENILLSGWALSTNYPEEHVEVIVKIEEEGQSRIINMTKVMRHDVLRVHMPDLPMPYTTKVGFSVQLSYPVQTNGVLSIFILKNTQEIQWLRMNIFKSQAVENFLDKINTQKNINLSNIKLEDIDAYIGRYNRRSISKICGVSIKIHEHLQSIINSVEDDSFIATLYTSKSGRVCCEKHDLHFTIKKTKLIGVHNFLFCYDGELTFIIYQNLSSIDGIYYPNNGIYYDFCVDSYSYAKCVIDYILSDNFTQNFHDHKNEIAFLIGHNRPYHFMYDGMLGLETIHCQGIEINDSANFYTLINEAFIDAPKVFNQKLSTTVIDNKRLNELENTGTLFIKLGCLFGLGGDNQQTLIKMSRLDKKIKAYSNEKNIQKDTIRAKLTRHFPIIWVGVTGQKRSWVEQTNGYASLICELYKSFPGMAVVFDGWTSSLSPNSRDEIESDKDRVVTCEIKKSIPSDITTVDLIGATIDQKIFIASIVDFGIVNYSTGSMNISRICGRPCISHMNNSFKPIRAAHIHHNTYHIPDSLITDINPEKHNIDATSYHLDWHHIYNAVLLHVGQQNLLKDRW